MVPVQAELQVQKEVAAVALVHIPFKEQSVFERQANRWFGNCRRSTANKRDVIMPDFFLQLYFNGVLVADIL